MGTSAGRPTLGEEYCDLVTVDARTAEPASVLVRSLSRRRHGLRRVLTPVLSVPRVSDAQQRIVHVVLHAVAPYLLITLARRAPDTATAPSGSADSSLWARLGAWASRLQAVLHGTLSPAHLMVFYFVGAFYYMSHRAASLRYVRLGA